jgi:DNA-binding XRE family transcriptional regulator
MTTATEPPYWVPEMTFPARLVLVRNRMGWNVKEAALACGLPPQNWRNWEEGKRPHDFLKVCQQISAHTNADLDWLVWGDEPRGVTRSSTWSPFSGESFPLAV